MTKTYSVYAVIGPKNKRYIGLSANVSKRWWSHCKKARSENKRHPFYDALRKYGRDAFTVETLIAGLSLPDAQNAEVLAIEMYRACERRHGYNISPGGEYDEKAGSTHFWASIRKDPEAFAAYRKRLSAGCKARLVSDAEKQRRVQKAREWRLANPELSLAISLRNREKATARSIELAKVGLRKKPKPASAATRAKMGASQRASWTPERRKKTGTRSRKDVTAVWARRTPEEKAAIGAKISAAMKAHHAGKTEEERQNDLDRLAGIRPLIDHTLRKRRQKEAIVAYWTPERRAEFSAKRKAANARKNV